MRHFSYSMCIFQILLKSCYYKLYFCRNLLSGGCSLKNPRCMLLISAVFVLPKATGSTLKTLNKFSPGKSKNTVKTKTKI